MLVGTQRAANLCWVWYLHHSLEVSLQIGVSAQLPARDYALQVRRLCSAHFTNAAPRRPARPTLCVRHVQRILAIHCLNILFSRWRLKIRSGKTFKVTECPHPPRWFVSFLLSTLSKETNEWFWWFYLKFNPPQHPSYICTTPVVGAFLTTSWAGPFPLPGCGMVASLALDSWLVSVPLLPSSYFTSELVFSSVEGRVLSLGHCPWCKD